MATYVQLTNELLRRLNEVPLDIAGDGFDSVRNVQAASKDAINNSLRQIFQVGQEWPFLKNTYTQPLTAGTRLYSFPSGYSSVDWETFYIKKHSTKQNQPQLLKAIPYEEYLQHYRSMDDTGDASGISVPTVVYQTFGDEFGVTPIPDSDYEIEYVYWSSPSDLALYSDSCVVPDRFNHVIIDGAMAYMMTFRSNEQSAAIHQEKFDQGIRTMRRVLVDDEMRLRSTMIERSARWTI